MDYTKRIQLANHLKVIISLVIISSIPNGHQFAAAYRKNTQPVFPKFDSRLKCLPEWETSEGLQKYQVECEVEKQQPEKCNQNHEGKNTKGATLKTIYDSSLAYIQLPDCMDVNIEMNRFRCFPNSTDCLRFCYPLSPQLLNCNLNAIDPCSYSIRDHTLLHSNFTAELGDYYIDNNGFAYTCKEPIEVSQTLPRCTNITLQPNQYTVFANKSVYLKPANVIIKRVKLTIDHQNVATLCYPLTIPFVNCDKKLVFMIGPMYYTNEPNFGIYFTNHDQHYKLGEYFYTSGGDDTVILCVPKYNLDESQLISKIFKIFYCVSTTCLIMTLIYQMMSPKLTCHSKCLVCHIVSLVVLYTVLTIGEYSNKGLPKPQCYTYFFSNYLSAMAAFFWLNVAAYDLWHCFTNLQNFKCHLQRKTYKFVFYSIFAWGMPLLMAIIIVLIDQFQSLQHFLKMHPGVGLQCWFHDKPSTWVFYYGPLMILTTINLIFFILTIMNIYCEGKGTQLVNKKRKTQL